MVGHTYNAIPTLKKLKQEDCYGQPRLQCKTFSLKKKSVEERPDSEKEGMLRSWPTVIHSVEGARSNGGSGVGSVLFSQQST